MGDREREPDDELSQAEQIEDADKTRSIPPDVPDADAHEQAQPWAGPDAFERPKIPPDVPEADALEQTQSVGDEDEDRPR